VDSPCWLEPEEQGNVPLYYAGFSKYDIAKPGGGYWLDLKVTTDSEGVAVFHIQGTLESGYCFDFASGAGAGWDYCSRTCFATADILRSGLVTENGCDPKHKLKQKFSAKPGEVIIFLKRWTFWDGLKRFPG
jgi:hypothetical protein